MKKYELTTETKVWFSKTLFRIRALMAFGDVKKGDLGGFVESEKNLDHKDNAWVSGHAWVSGNARVSGHAEVYRNAHYLLIGPVGSRDGFTTFSRNKDRGITVVCGCFNGSIDKFEAAVLKTHGDNQHGKAYRQAIEMARAQIDLAGDDEEE